MHEHSADCGSPVLGPDLSMPAAAENATVAYTSVPAQTAAFAKEAVVSHAAAPGAHSLQQLE